MRLDLFISDQYLLRYSLAKSTLPNIEPTLRASSRFVVCMSIQLLVHIDD